jgi:small subunit ribosomal protein S6
MDYELLLMLDPELPDDRQTEIVTRMRELIERGGGRWSSHDAWGRRRLAYEIDHKQEGVYHLVTFAVDAETLDELSRILRITDGVMRHLAVRRVKGSRTSAPPPVAVGPPAYSTNRRSSEEEEES